MTAKTSEKLDLDHLRTWIGNTEEVTDVVTAHLVRGLRATLFMEPGTPKPGDPAPYTAHWCLAPPVVAASEIGPDGHPARGAFLPPVPLPRRMWAGGDVEIVDPLRVGDEVKRSSKIVDVAVKSGSTGVLCFVAIDHVITTPRGVAIRERQNVVYREAPSGSQTPASEAPAKAPPPAQHSKSHIADPVLLFRYSALTFNGHRIHYDREYVTKVEGYPGLIFHGPLQASLMVEMAASLRGGKPPTKFTNRGVQPLFDGQTFTVNANETSSGMEMWTANSAGIPTMKATAAW